MTDECSNVVWANYEFAWGGTYQRYYKEQSLNGTPIDKDHLQPLKFQGQFFDPETSLHYNRFRYYDSDVGMFIQRDPIGLLGGMNVFAYASNPVGWVDPFGLNPCKGLPSSRKKGGTGKHYDKQNGQGLYVLRDPAQNNKIVYVGRGDVHARGMAHSNNPKHKNFIQDIIFDNNLSKAEAKFLEQKLMGRFGGAKSANPNTTLSNEIRSYSRKTNPNASTYNKAGHSKSWGKQILRDAFKQLK